MKKDDFNPSAFSKNLLKKAATKLNSGKSDPSMNFTSDCLSNGPEKLFELLAQCLKCFIIHGHVSNFLLYSTIVPIVKDKLGDLTNSNNYRSIAISSLVMKIFDHAIIDVCSSYLQFDDLQFSYQAEVFTSMCTWLATETISYFLRKWT